MEEHLREVETSIDVLLGWEVMPGVVAGYETVVIVADINRATGGETRLFTLASEDARRLARDLNHVGAGVKPMHKQIPKQGEV